MYSKRFVVLLYLAINYKIVLCNHHLEYNELVTVNHRSQVFQLIDDNSSYILPTDDKICNWGDLIEHFAPELQYKDKLIYSNLHINDVANHQTLYKFEKHISADIIITEVRLVNVGRQRGFVKCLEIKRTKINEDVIKAEIVVKAKDQFRLWVEIYAYDSAYSIFRPWISIALLSLLNSINNLI